MITIVLLYVIAYALAPQVAWAVLFCHVTGLVLWWFWAALSYKPPK